MSKIPCHPGTKLEEFASIRHRVFAAQKILDPCPIGLLRDIASHHRGSEKAAFEPGSM